MEVLEKKTMGLLPAIFNSIFNIIAVSIICYYEGHVFSVLIFVFSIETLLWLKPESEEGLLYVHNM